MLKKTFTTLMMAYPLLFVYATKILTLTVADIFLLALFPFLAIEAIKSTPIIKNMVSFPMFLAFFYFVIQLLFLFVLKDIQYINKILMPTARYLLYLCTIVFFVKGLFDIDLGFRILKFIAVFASVYVIVQFILINTIHFYLPGMIPGLPTSSGDQITEWFNSLNGYSDIMTRPRSIFLEPSHYAIYVLLYFGIELFQNSRKNFGSLSVVFLGLLLSSSTTAILGLIIILITWFFLTISRLPFNEKIKYILKTCSGVALIAIIFCNSPAFEILYTRTFVSGQAITGRFENYSTAFSWNGLSIWEIIFGRGMYKLDMFIPSIPKLFYFSGLMGMLYFFIASFLTLKKGDWIQRIVMILLIALAFESEFIFGNFILVYAPFIILRLHSKAIARECLKENSARNIYSSSYSLD